VLAPTPIDRWTDARGRPYFLWHCEVTLDELRALLRDPDDDVRAYWLGTVMRQAKPDDALVLASPAVMRELWPKLADYLGQRRDFWTWYVDIATSHEK
jgi:hypothetical protein